MRYKIPRWVGLATLLITATKLGIPAFAQEFEPLDQSIDPSVEETGEVVDPGVEVIDPGSVTVDGGEHIQEPDGEGVGAADECPTGPPGLYRSDCETPAEGVWFYEPAYKLWSDGAAKERYLYLPPIDEDDPSGPKQPIDASNPDQWVFPVKTRLYKTFRTPDQVRKYETRIIEKTPEIDPETGENKWTLIAYEWDFEQTRAFEAADEGHPDVFGPGHDIPSKSQCLDCHNSSEKVLGVSAIQLSPNGMLTDLIKSGRLKNWANSQEAAMIAAAAGESAEVQAMALENAIDSYRTRATILGDDVQKQAVGYLHANCGHCHGGQFPDAQMTLFSKVLTELPTEATGTAPVGINAICATSRWRSPPPERKQYTHRILPGKASDSAIIGRMSVRDNLSPDQRKPFQMPWLATEVRDEVGIALVSDWINNLPPCPTPLTFEVEAPVEVF